jgi:hypothetical protein
MTAADEDLYRSYEGFLRGAIRAYWDSGRGSKANFLAFLLASREAWQVAWEGVTAPGSSKKILTGAAGATALALLLRTVVGGPIGILLTGASIASLVAVYVKNHHRIWARVDHYRELVDDYRPKFEEIRTEYVDGHVRRDQRDLMVDGLLARFLNELTDFDPGEANDDQVEDAPETFSEHAERKKAQEAQETED